jgi:hypothetical protein
MRTAIILVALILLLSACDQAKSPQANDHRIVKRGEGYILQYYQDWPEWNDLCRSEPKSLEYTTELKDKLEKEDEVVENR